MRNWKEWARAAAIRAVRTFAQAMIAYIGTGAIMLKDVNWLAALSVSALSAILSLLMSVATGLPEVSDIDSGAGGENNE